MLKTVKKSTLARYPSYAAFVEDRREAIESIVGFPVKAQNAETMLQADGSATFNVIAIGERGKEFKSIVYIVK